MGGFQVSLLQNMIDYIDNSSLVIPDKVVTSINLCDSLINS